MKLSVFLFLGGILQLKAYSKCGKEEMVRWEERAETCNILQRHICK